MRARDWGRPPTCRLSRCSAAALDLRSDMFSLGVLLHELTTGAHPFLRANAADTMAAILRDPPSSGRRDVNSVPGLDALLLRMLAKSSSDRVQTMSELRVELEALRERGWLTTSTSQTTAAEPQSGPSGPRLSAARRKRPSSNGSWIGC